MAKLNPLIKDEELDIDDHLWGSGQPSEWGGGYHIHKRFIDGRRDGIEIRFPIDTNAKLIISPSDSTQLNSIIREIRKAFGDRQIRERFANDLAKIFHAILVKNNTTAVRRSVKRIVRHFGLDEQIINEVAEKYRGRLIRYSAIHKDPNDNAHHAIIVRENRISISAELEKYPPDSPYWKYHK